MMRIYATLMMGAVCLVCLATRAETTANQLDLQKLAEGTATEASNALLRLTQTPTVFVANYDALLATAATTDGSLEAAVLESGRTWRPVPSPCSPQADCPRWKGTLLWVSECLWWCGPHSRQDLLSRYIEAVNATVASRGADRDQLWRIEAIYYTSFRQYVKPEIYPREVVTQVMEATRKQVEGHRIFLSSALRNIAYMCPEQRNELVTLLLREFPDAFPPQVTDPIKMLRSPYFREQITGEIRPAVPVTEGRYFELHSMSAGELADTLAKYDPPRVVDEEYYVARDRLVALARNGKRDAQDETLELLDHSVRFIDLARLALEGNLRSGATSDDEEYLQRILTRCRGIATSAPGQLGTYAVIGFVEWYLSICKETHQALLFEKDLIDIGVEGLVASHDTDDSAWGSILKKVLGQAGEVGLRHASDRLSDALETLGESAEQATGAKRKHDELASLQGIAELRLEEE